METQTGLLNIRLAELLKFHLPKTLLGGRGFQYFLGAQVAFERTNVVPVLELPGSDCRAYMPKPRDLAKW
jgi:hypothetical protein